MPAELKKDNYRCLCPCSGGSGIWIRRGDNGCSEYLIILTETTLKVPCSQSGVPCQVRRGWASFPPLESRAGSQAPVPEDNGSSASESLRSSSCLQPATLYYPNILSPAERELRRETYSKQQQASVKNKPRGQPTKGELPPINEGSAAPESLSFGGFSRYG